MAEQKKGTPILMKFFSDAFAAHLRTVSVNYTLHQYKLSVAPSGESDTDLLENAIRAIGNAKPAVQNSLMSTQQIMREPNLPKQMMDDFDLHAQWCQSTLEELDLCDATIRNAILSKDDYLAILSQALSPYYDAMGIPEDYQYPGENRGTPVTGDDSEEEPEEDGPAVEEPDDMDAPQIINAIDDSEDTFPGEPVDDDTEDGSSVDDPLMAEMAVLRQQISFLLAQNNLHAMPDDDTGEEPDFEGPFPMDDTGRTVGGTTGVIDEVYELTDEGLVGTAGHDDVIPVPSETVIPMDTPEPIVLGSGEPTEDEPEVDYDEDLEDGVPMEPSVQPRPVIRPMMGTYRMAPLQPRGRTSIAVEPETAPAPVFEPEPTVDNTPESTTEPEEPVYTSEELTKAARRIIEENHSHDPAPVDPYHQPASPETDYAGLFGYDQYDEPDQPQPLAEDPVRLSQIAEKASEVIIAARKKGGRAATKSTGTSGKGKPRSTAKAGTKKTASKSTGRTAKPRKKASDAPVTTSADAQSVVQTDSETPSHTTDNEQEDTQ